MFIFKLLHIILLLLTTPNEEIKKASSNGMHVLWHFTEDHIHFSIQALGKGWLAIGFSETMNLNNTYLLMGAISGKQVVVKEHYIFKPGSYQSFDQLQEPESIENIRGIESEKGTTVQFSLPQTSFYQYVKHLKPGMEYHLLLAYSQDDDFKHHSMMRTSIEIKL